jgi:pimeloyl-ACP methyl ester carboxylesterase
MHGLLWSSRMLERISGLLPGTRVLLLDLHGHGRSSQPTDPARYTWDEMAADVFALLDHLSLDRAAVGGLSLGANVTLAAAQLHPERVTGMVLEMPVLRRGHRFGRPAFSALAATYRAGRAPLTAVASAIGRVPVPRSIPDLAALREMAAADPAVAAAILRGLLDDEPVPEDPASLARLTMPALVIGHRKDPLHVLADARDLTSRLPQARLVEASSIMEMRLHPTRLADEITAFLDSL